MTTTTETTTICFPSPVFHACSPKADSGRYEMKAVRVQKDSPLGPVAIATDGRILAVVPLDPEACEALPDSAMIPASTLEAAWRAKGRHSEARVRIIDGAAVASTKAGDIAQKLADDRFPNVFPILESAQGTPTVRFGVDAALLLRLAKAIGSDGRCILEVQDAVHPILVRAIDGQAEAYGVIMSVMI